MKTTRTQGVCWRQQVFRPVRMLDFLLLAIATLFSLNGAQAQLAPGVPVNFGIDGGVIANRLHFGGLTGASGTDDWFFDANWPGLGKNVIDQTNAASIKAAILAAPSNKYQFSVQQSVPTFTTMGGYQWIDAIYIRDDHSGTGNDQSAFPGGSDNNADNPSTWESQPNSTPPKSDLLDVMAHLRRDLSNNNYWFFGGASYRTTNGEKHLDFEFLRGAISVVGNAFVSAGPDGGRTSWKFASGSVTQAGDILMTIDYQNGGTNAITKLYVWMHPDMAPQVQGFFNLLGAQTPGLNTNGYVWYQIDVKPGFTDNSLFTAVNSATTTAGPWGTLDDKGVYRDDYLANQFAEFGINLTAYGLDNIEGVNPCGGLFGSILVKTRTSASFNAQLKDYVGPYAFGGSFEPSVTASKSADLTCAVTSVTLTASNIIPAAATIKWYGPSVGSDMGPELPADGADQGDGTKDPTRIVSDSGTYTVVITAPGRPACQATSTVTVAQDITPPTCGTLSGPNNICPGTTATYGGPAGMASYAWSITGGASIEGPLNGPTVSVRAGNTCASFTLTLVITGANGCTSNCEATFNVADSEKPTVTGQTTITGTQCNVQPAFITPTAADNCTVTPALKEGYPMTSTVTIENCTHSISRTWIYVDGCGNESIPFIQTVSWTVDTDAPIIETPPATWKEVACGTGITFETLPWDVPVWSDACGTVIPVSDVMPTVDLGCGHEYTRTWTVKDACNNEATFSQTIYLPCCEACSYTQGFWGNKNGLAKMTEVFAAYDGNLVIGDMAGRYILIPTDNASAIALNKMLPGGQKADVLSSSCTNAATWTTCMASTYLTKQGRINNNLLSQTISLTLNVLNDPRLGVMSLSPCFRTTYGGGTWYIPQEVLDCLDETPTVNELLAFANKVLGGTSTCASPAAVNSAVDAINNAFDECAFYLGECEAPITSGSINAGTVDGISITPTADAVSVTAYPNPFGSEIFFKINSNTPGKVKLSLVDVSGRVLGSVFEGVLKGGSATIRYSADALPRTMIMYRLETNGKTITGKLIPGERGK